MKKLITIILVLVCGVSLYAQNPVYGSKVVGIDSVVTDTIRAFSQTYPHLEGVTIGTQIEFTSGSGAAGRIISNTTDGSDAGNIAVNGGGDISFNRGGQTVWYGNEVLSFGGSITHTLGDATSTADFNIQDGAGDIVTAFDQSEDYWDFKSKDLYNINTLTSNVQYLTPTDNADSVLITTATTGGGISYNVSVAEDYSWNGGFSNGYNLTDHQFEFGIGSSETGALAIGNSTSYLGFEYNGNTSAPSWKMEVRNTSALDEESRLLIQSDSTILIDADSTIFENGDVVVEEDLYVEGNLTRMGC
jgi:hypothetical protein